MDTILDKNEIIASLRVKISEMEKRFDDKIQTAQNDLLVKLGKEKEKFSEEKSKELENKFKEG